MIPLIIFSCVGVWQLAHAYTGMIWEFPVLVPGSWDNAIRIQIPHRGQGGGRSVCGGVLISPFPALRLFSVSQMSSVKPLCCGGLNEYDFTVIGQEVAVVATMGLAINTRDIMPINNLTMQRMTLDQM